MSNKTSIATVILFYIISKVALTVSTMTAMHLSLTWIVNAGIASCLVKIMGIGIWSNFSTQAGISFHNVRYIDKRRKQNCKMRSNNVIGKLNDSFTVNTQTNFPCGLDRDMN